MKGDKEMKKMQILFDVVFKRIKGLRKGLKSEKGFTLIEIMIVVAIIAILIGLVAPNLFRRPQTARVEAAKVKISQLSVPLLEYFQTNGNFPSSEEGLEALVASGLIKKKDLLDPWGNAFGYRYPGEYESGEYELWSYGADGQEGGEGFNSDITSWE